MALNFELLDTYQTWDTWKAYTVATTDIFTSVGHGLIDNDIIRVYPSAGVLATPLIMGVNYYVKKINNDTFYLALTPGGATIDITTTGGANQKFYRSNEYKLFTAAVDNIITSAGHGLVDEELINLRSNGALPAGIPNWAYVIYIDVDTFKISLTAGGDEIDITDTGTGTHWWEKKIGYRSIRQGDLITNGVAEGIVTYSVRTQFNMSDVISISFLVTSGAFADKDACSTSGGGTLYIYGTPTTVTEDTIMIDGVDDSDSTADLTGAIDDSVTTIYNTNYSVLPNLRYIKIDDEWMFILYSGNGVVTNTFSVPFTSTFYKVNHGLTTGQVIKLTTTGALPTGLSTGVGYYVKKQSDDYFTVSLTLNGANVTVTVPSGSGTHTYTLQDALTVKRAMFGTTAASHADNATIYILSENVADSICTEDASEGWGLCDKSTGKYIINANVFLGRPDQAGQTLVLSVLDRVEINDLYITGGNTYKTIVQSGVGWVDSGVGVYTGFYLNGSNIITDLVSFYQNSTLNLYGGSLVSEDWWFEGTCNFMITSLASMNYNNFIIFSNREPCKIYMSWINNQRASASSIELDWNGVYINYKIMQESVYFLGSGGDATVRNVEMVDSQFDTGMFAFAAGGTKTFIDCKLSTSFGQFLAGVTCVHKKSVNMNAVTQDAIDIPNVSAKIFDKNDVLVNSGSSDVSGVWDEELVEIYNTDDAVDLNPFKFVVTKAGWKDKAFDVTIDEPKVYEFVMENAGLTEEEN